MLLFIAAFIASAIGYWFLQDIEDKRADSEGRHRASLPRRMILWFFLWMISLVLFHFAGLGGSSENPFGGKGIRIGLPGSGPSGSGIATGGSGGSGGSGAAVGAATFDPTEMLKRIPEEVAVGMPPF